MDTVGMTHAELRAEMKARGLRNSFDGSSSTYMRSLLDQLQQGECAPPQLMRADQLRQSRRHEYDELLRGVTLERLATCFPETRWQKLRKRGWARLSLRLSSRERQLCALTPK